MESRYKLVVSRGFIQLKRCGDLSARPYRGRGNWISYQPLERWGDEPERSEVADLEPPEWAYGGYDPDPEAEELEAGDPDERGVSQIRGDGGQTSRSRNNMRRMFASLPWELLGPRPAMLSLTYPGEWKLWVPDGRVWEQHRRAFERRWVRKWKAPLVGVWVKEFQESGRPHMHLYVGLPGQVTAEDFDGLRKRTLLRHRLEWAHGRNEGRARLPAIGGRYGGDFAMWLRTTWSEIVGTQGVIQAHHARGVDVAVMFWTDEVAATQDRTKVAEYLAKEASKWRQKKPPEGFVGLGRYYGRWGRRVGFNPVSEEVGLDMLVAWQVERRLERWVNWKLHVQRRGAPPKTAFYQRRPGDGVTAFGLGHEGATRVLKWSRDAAAREESRQARLRGSGGVAPGEMTMTG